MRRFLDFLPRLWTNWITLFGAVITSLSGISLMVFLLLEVLTTRDNAYRSGLLVLFLPILLIIGLLIIPIGFFIERRRAAARKERGESPAESAIEQAFTLALRDRVSRGRIFFVALLTLVNIVLIAAGGQKTVAFMDSPKFCGASCHVPMEPEWTAYQRSPHSRVACVECHIGPGAGAFVQAKMRGTAQLLGVITNNYHRPVPAPVEHMRTTDATCEGCHARGKSLGQKVKLYPHYQADKDNTAAFNVEQLHLGGIDPRTGKYTGIHKHNDPNRTIQFEYLDERRSRIGKITVLEGGQTVAEYLPKAGTAKDPVLGVRTMQCIDCHNRPTHRFDGTAKQAVELAMWQGVLDAKAPFLAKVATEVIGKAQPAREEAGDYFQKALTAAYASVEGKPAQVDIDKAAKGLTEVYLRNVFPKMKVGFGTYPDLAGHYSEKDDEVTGCFRCHDEEHTAKLPDGTSKTMNKSCDLCHESMATEKPPEQLDDPTKQAVGIPLD